MFKSVLTFTTFLCFGAALVFLGCGKSDFIRPLPAGTDGMLYAVGIGKSPELSLARKMARHRAREELASVAQTNVTALSKDFQQQLGTGDRGQINAAFSQVSEALVDQRLMGAREIGQGKEIVDENGVWTVQIMFGLPIKDNIENPLIAEISQDEALYQEFQAWKGHNELAKKVKELREQ